MYEELNRRSELIGPPLKRDETSMAERMLVYCKRWIYEDSLPQTLKRVAKIATQPNAAMPERDVLCSSTWASALNASEGSCNPIPPSRSFSLFRHEFRRNTTSPTTRPKIAGCGLSAISGLGKISLDFKKWCQHLFGGNHSQTGEVLDQAFGLEGTFGVT